LFGQLLADFSPARRGAVETFFAEVSKDQALLPQLTPEGMDVFDAATRDRPGVRYGSVVTRARPPGVRSTLAAGLDPSAQASHAVYQALYRIASRTPQVRAPALAPAQARRLRRAYGTLPGAGANDGIVPTRARILAAAEERFAAFGYRRTGIAEIARDAGVAPGTLYRYFENKEEIFRAVMREGLARWLETARRVLAQPGTALDRLARLGQASVDYNRENALINSVYRRDGEI